jgi:CRP-like cAMP-binding protein
MEEGKKPMELIPILKQVELFRGLDADQLERVVAISKKETYSADDVIFAQGSRGSHMYIIAAGEVEVRVDDPNGGHTAIFLGAGQIFGEMALLDQGERSASVIATRNNTVVYSIASADMLSLCQANTALGFAIMRNMAIDLSFKLRHQNSASPSGL